MALNNELPHRNRYGIPEMGLRYFGDKCHKQSDLRLAGILQAILPYNALYRVVMSRLRCTGIPLITGMGFEVFLLLAVPLPTGPFAFVPAFGPWAESLPAGRARLRPEPSAAMGAS
jgi:hypothetical protein